MLLDPVSQLRVPPCLSSPVARARSIPRVREITVYPITPASREVRRDRAVACPVASPLGERACQVRKRERIARSLVRDCRRRLPARVVIAGHCGPHDLGRLLQCSHHDYMLLREGTRADRHARLDGDFAPALPVERPTADLIAREHRFVAPLGDASRHVMPALQCSQG